MTTTLWQEGGGGFNRLEIFVSYPEVKLVVTILTLWNTIKTKKKISLKKVHNWAEGFSERKIIKLPCSALRVKILKAETIQSCYQEPFLSSNVLKFQIIQ